ncbi:MAG: hypothetical protein ACLGHL_06225, partial [Actinomycetota bacterium]
MRTKISAGIGALLASVLAIFALLYVETGEVNDRMRLISSELGPRIDAAFEIEVNSNGLALATLAFLQSGSEGSFDQALEGERDLAHWAAQLELLDQRFGAAVQQTTERLSSRSGDAIRHAREKADVAREVRDAAADLITHLKDLSGVGPGAASERPREVVRDAARAVVAIVDEVSRSSSPGSGSDVGRASRFLQGAVQALGDDLDGAVARALMDESREIGRASRRVLVQQDLLVDATEGMLAERDRLDVLLDKRVQPATLRELGDARGAVVGASDRLVGSVVVVVPLFL